MVAERSKTLVLQIQLARMRLDPGLNPTWGEIIPAIVVIEIQLYVPYSPWIYSTQQFSHTHLSCYPTTVGIGSKDGGIYKPTIWERQSLSLSKTHLGLKGEDTHRGVGRWSKKGGVSLFYLVHLEEFICSH